MVSVVKGSDERIFSRLDCGDFFRVRRRRNFQRSARVSESGNFRDETAFSAAYDLYSAGKFGEADDRFASCISTYPYTELTDKARFYRGEMAFSRENYKTAISFYREAYSQIQSPTIVPMARFKAALSLHRLGDDAGALRDSADRQVVAERDTQAEDRFPRSYSVAQNRTRSREVRRMDAFCSG